MNKPTEANGDLHVYTSPEPAKGVDPLGATKFNLSGDLGVATGEAYKDPIPENIIGERRDIGENIAATEAALREEGRAEILAYKKILEAEQNVAPLEASGLSPEDTKSEVAIEQNVPSSLEGAPARIMTAADIGLETKPAASEEVSRATDEPSSEDQRLAELETKLSSPDFSDAEKGSFEEERDALRREVSQKKELEKIEKAVASVASGDEAEVTLEVPVATFAAYGEELKARLNKAESTYGAEREAKKVEDELSAFEKKEASFTQSRESLLFVKQKLEDTNLSPEERGRFEKQAKILERISGKLEKKRQSQDRGFLEKGAGFLKEQIAERWRKGHWATKLAIGAGLSVASFGLAAPFLRSLSSYSMYQGVKQKQMANFAAEIKKLEEFGASEEAKEKEIEKFITENTWSKKGLVVGALMFATPYAIEAASETILAVGGQAVDLAKESIFGNTDVAAAASEGAAGAGAESAAVVVGAAAAEAASTLYEHASHAVAQGDTMYSILENEFNISQHLPEEGRQYNAIENILAQIKANPAEYGITSGDVNNLAVGDTINIEKIGEIVANHKIAGEGILDHAKGLPAAVVSGIENYMPGEAKAAFSAIAAHKAEVATATVGSAAPVGEVTGQVLTGETTLEALAAEDAASGVVVQPNTDPGFVAPEIGPVTPTGPEIGIIPAVFSMTETESLRGASLLMADMTRLGGNWADVTRFGAEPIATFVNNPPLGSEKIMSLLQNYRGGAPITANEPGTVLQYLQRAALTSVRASNIA